MLQDFLIDFIKHTKKKKNISFPDGVARLKEVLRLLNKPPTFITIHLLSCKSSLCQQKFLGDITLCPKVGPRQSHSTQWHIKHYESLTGAPQRQIIVRTWGDNAWMLLMLVNANGPLCSLSYALWHPAISASNASRVLPHVNCFTCSLKNHVIWSWVSVYFFCLCRLTIKVTSCIWFLKIAYSLPLSLVHLPSNVVTVTTYRM